MAKQGITIILLVFLFSKVFSQDTGETTIGIITSKKHLDTVACFATLKDRKTKRKIDAIIYSVRQEYKKVDLEPFAVPKYYYQHIEYLGQDKRILPNTITILKSTDLK